MAQLVHILILLTLPLWILLMFFWWIFVKMVNFFGIAEVKNINGSLQTPVVFYEHPETGKTVLFIGMTHIADKKYFDKVAKIALGCEKNAGHKILYEHCKSADSVRDFSKKELKIHNQILAYRHIHQKIADVMGLEYQTETSICKKAPMSWMNNDLDERFFIWMLLQKQTCLLENLETKERLLEQMNESTVGWLGNKSLTEGAATFLISKWLCKCSLKRKRLLEVAINYRNQIAFSEIEKQLNAGYSVVNIWGAAHLPGIGKMLEKKGFKKIRQEWLTAYQNKKYSFWKALISPFKK